MVVKKNSFKVMNRYIPIHGNWCGQRSAIRALVISNTDSENRGGANGSLEHGIAPEILNDSLR